MVLYLLLLCPVSLLLVPMGIGGKLYLWTALLAGLGFLLVGIEGLRSSSGVRWARSLFKASLLYLMVVFGAMLAGHALHGSQAPSLTPLDNPLVRTCLCDLERSFRERSQMEKGR